MCGYGDGDHHLVAMESPGVCPAGVGEGAESFFKGTKLFAGSVSVSSKCFLKCYYVPSVHFVYPDCKTWLQLCARQRKKSENCVKMEDAPVPRLGRTQIETASNLLAMASNLKFP